MNPSTPTPILATERLVLRPGLPADAGAIAAFLRENDAHLAPWSPEPPPEHFDASFWAHKLAAEAADRAAGRGVRFLFAPPEAPDAVIGWAHFSTIVRGVWHCSNLGYAIGAGHQGQGLMLEGLRGALAHAFGPMNLHRIQANYMPANVRSARVLRTLGFKVEGYAYDFLRIAGRWEDHVLTSLTNPDWRDPTP